MLIMSSSIYPKGLTVPHPLVFECTHQVEMLNNASMGGTNGFEASSTGATRSKLLTMKCTNEQRPSSTGLAHVYP